MRNGTFLHTYKDNTSPCSQITGPQRNQGKSTQIPSTDSRRPYRPTTLKSCTRKDQKCQLIICPRTTSMPSPGSCYTSNKNRRMVSLFVTLSSYSCRKNFFLMPTSKTWSAYTKNILSLRTAQYGPRLKDKQNPAECSTRAQFWISCKTSMGMCCLATTAYKTKE